MAKSRFTDAGLALFAAWEQSPENKRPFSKMKIGNLSDADYNNDNLYDGSETDLHGTATQLVESVQITLDPNDTTKTTVRVKATIVPAAAVKGQTIREVGLYITDESDNDVLVWIGKFPPTYIPAANEPDMQTDLVVTVPIKFNNAETAAIYTSDAAYALQTDLDRTNANLADVETELNELKTRFTPIVLSVADNLETKTLQLRNYERIRIFTFDHSNHTITVSGYENVQEITAAIADNITEIEVTGYKLRYRSANFFIAMLPVNFGKAVLDILSTDANERPNITEFVFTNNAAFANSTKGIVTTTPPRRYKTTLVVATTGLGGNMVRSEAWILPADNLGANFAISGHVDVYLPETSI